MFELKRQLTLLGLKMTILSVWSRHRLEHPFLPGAGADPLWPERKSAPGPRTSGAAQKSRASTRLVINSPRKTMAVVE